MIAAIVWLISVASMIVSLWASPDHRISGLPAAVIILAMIGSGGAMAAVLL